MLYSCNHEYDPEHGREGGMTATIQINTRGNMTLPVHIRRALGIEKGGVVMAEAAQGGVLLRPAVAYPIELYTDERVAEFDAAENKLKNRLSRKANL
jgi:bifunctional DNA-binding transcriptional regulator/antitoxin component of YhaV-PrlF toxin-antitoxin module